jgi:hypothetical protein
MGGSGPQNLPQIPDRRFELLPPRRKYSDVGLNQLDQQLKVVAGAQVTRWYLGFDQAIDSAALHLYAVYQHLTDNVDLVDKNLNGVNEPLDNFDLFYTGARMYF